MHIYIYISLEQVGAYILPCGEGHKNNNNNNNKTTLSFLGEEKKLWGKNKILKLGQNGLD